MDKNNVPHILITCHHCDYYWFSISKRDYVTCSRCGYRINTRKYGVVMDE